VTGERTRREGSFSGALLRGYLFGLGRYPFGRYALSLALAELLFGIASVHLGVGIRATAHHTGSGDGLGVGADERMVAGCPVHRRLTRPRDLLKGEVVPAAQSPPA
jgi:hypothetical protein